MAMVILAGIFDVDDTIKKRETDFEAPVTMVLRGIEGLFPIGPATGRNLDFCKKLAQDAGRRSCWDYMIAENGGVLHPHTNDRSLSSNDLMAFKDLIGFNPDKGWFCLGEYDKEPKESIMTIFPRDCANKTSIMWEEFFLGIIRQNGLKIRVIRHIDSHLDLVPNYIDKKLGVDMVCELYGIRPENILTFVDGPNDEGLVAGTIPVAVANADETIKELAKKNGGYVASLPYGRGVLEGLYHFAQLGAFDGNSRKITGIIRAHFPEVMKIKIGG